MTLLLLAACSSPGTANTRSPAPPARQPDGSIVAAFGDDEVQTRQSIDAATRAGKIPRYVTISTTSASHVFPPYAQILKTSSTVVARAYGRMYVWRAQGTTVSYSAAAKDVKDTLPLAEAVKLDKLAARSHQTALTKLGKSVCGDCLLILGGAPRGRRQTDPWAALKDPWQVAPDYTFWNAGVAVANAQSATRKTSNNFCEVTPIGPNETYIGGCYYYYTYYQPYQYPYPRGGGGGGGGGGAPAPPPPCPPVGGPASLQKAISKDDFAQAVSQAVANNYGGKATTVNTKDSLPGAHEAAEAHSQDGKDASGNAFSRNSIDWSTSGVAAAVKNGQNEAQIYTHEELHLWYETLNADGSGRPNPVPGEAGFQSTRTVTMSDGTILTFNISATNGVLNDAYTGFEHVNIHDQLVGNDGVDLTGAMGEALAEASSIQFPGGQPQSIPHTADGKPDYAAGLKMASDHKMSAATISSGGIDKKPPATPDPNAGCGKTAGTSHARQANGTARRSGSSVGEDVGGYIVIWNGAQY
jgi:hypothetical protein